MGYNIKTLIFFPRNYPYNAPVIKIVNPDGILLIETFISN
jgi:ubiquitin-protein ligase